LSELNDKLRAAEEREATLLVELSEIREQNELLEFRLLEMEEISMRKDSPDAMDSGIVSPEPAHTNKVSFLLLIRRQCVYLSFISCNAISGLFNQQTEKPRRGNRDTLHQ